MRRATPLVIMAFGVLACSSVPTESSAKDDKGTEVEIDGLKATTPADWKVQTPSGLLKPKFQFQLPKKGEDKYDAELKIYEGLGGSVEQNVERWKGSFTPPKGKTLDDVCKVEKVEFAGRKATYVDISGTYKFRDPTSGKEEQRPDYRMLAIQLDGKNETYHFKLIGPAATVEMYKKGFDEWLKALK